MNTRAEWLRKGELVTLGRSGITCQVVDATPTAEMPHLFSDRTARQNPMIYRFRDLAAGDEFCLSHSALTEAELQSRR